jgi:hypothetical protein
VNPQELFIDVSSGRFLDGNSAIAISKPSVYSDEQKKMLINVRKVRNNQVSVVTPAENARFKFRIGTPALKLAEGIDVSTAPPVLITALGSVVTAPASQATGIALLSNYAPVTATIRADVSQVTAVTATITVGITTTTALVSVTTVAVNADYPSNTSIYLPRPRHIVLSMSAVLNTTAAAQITASFFDGSVTTMSITNRGSGYPNGTFDLKFTGGGATAGTVTATGTAVASGGIITQLTLSSGGSGYASAPIVTLFTPEKSVKNISVSNKIGDFGANKQRFYWAYATTSVSTPAVAVNFSAPDATSTTAFITTPSAVIRSVGLNIWELELISSGYGYINAPTVTHDAALVSTSKISSVVTFANSARNPGAYITDFSKQTYIRNGGLAVVYDYWRSNDVRYSEIGKGESSDGAYAYSAPRSGKLILAEPSSGSDTSYRINSAKVDEAARNNEPAVQLTDDYGNSYTILLSETTDSFGGVTYQAPYSFTGRLANFRGGESEKTTRKELTQQYESIRYGFYRAADRSPFLKAAIYAASTGKLNTSYFVSYGIRNISFTGSSPLTKIIKTQIDLVNPGGGIYEPSYEIIEYGEGYNQSKYYDEIELFPLQTKTLLETASIVSASIFGTFIDSPISSSATIATRPGRFSTQYFIANPGFGYTYTGGGAEFSTIPVATGGIVTTASLTNNPQAYGDGEYDCVVQSPSVGTAAKLSLIVENGSARVVVLDGGAGYTSKPIVTAPAPNVQTGFIERAIITNTPRGYEIGKQYLLESSSSPITGGNCSLVMIDSGNGPVVQILERGFGYSSNPVITAPSPDLPQGVINFIATTTQGAGYANGSYECNIQQAPAGGKTPKIVFQKTSASGGFSVLEAGYGYITAPIVSAVTPAGNIINSITITCGGTFYQNSSIAFNIYDSSGASAEFGNPTICGGIITNIPIANKGYGYSDAPTIAFEPPQLPVPSSLELSQVQGTLNITTASANAILTTANNRDVFLEVYETDGTNEQVVVQATMNLAKRVLE